MRLGILAYASPTGLGYQTRDYVNHLEPSKILAVDLSQYNMMPVYREWYKDFNTQWVNGIPTNADIDTFLNDLDVVFLAETPLNYYLFEEAKRRGIKVFHAYNYEFLDYFKHPEYAPPHVFAAPTLWNINIVRGLNKAPVYQVPVPVERPEEIRKITELKRIIHVIGRPAVHDRNGTLSLLSAIEKIGKKYEYVFFLQEPKDGRAVEYFEPVRLRLNELQAKGLIKVHTNILNNSNMYLGADLLVLPRRYGGLCLPMQEALARGIPVIMTNVSPNNFALPSAWLCRASEKAMFRGHAEIPVYDADVDDLVARIELFSHPEFMTAAHVQATFLGEQLSWEILKPKYLQWFATL